MHIPDGFLDVPVAVAFALLTALVVAVALRRLNGEVPSERVPLLGVIAAGIFAAQLLNWPIPGGTSAHFVGGALAGILLGPWLGVLAMVAVVSIQALVFGDGGLLVLGANLWNMAVVNVLVGYAVFHVLEGRLETGRVFLAGWAGITVAALFVGLQTGLSSAFAYQLEVTLLIMGGGHAVLGLIEGAITHLVYRFVTDARPDLAGGRGPVGRPGGVDS
jgi:cobalt/nickel transport system permease protein